MAEDRTADAIAEEIDRLVDEIEAACMKHAPVIAGSALVAVLGITAFTAGYSAGEAVPMLSNMLRATMEDLESERRQTLI